MGDMIRFKDYQTRYAKNPGGLPSQPEEKSYEEDQKSVVGSHATLAATDIAQAKKTLKEKPSIVTTETDRSELIDEENRMSLST